MIRSYACWFILGAQIEKRTKMLDQAGSHSQGAAKVEVAKTTAAAATSVEYVLTMMIGWTGRKMSFKFV